MSFGLRISPDWLTAIGTIVAAAFSAMAAIYSAVAAESWHFASKQARIDEAVAAMHNCAAAIGRVVQKKGKPNAGTK